MKEPEMKIKNDNKKDKYEIPFRLILKNIPCNLSNEKLEEIFSKNFSEEIENETLIVNLDKKYSMKKRSKICFVTTKNFSIRNKIYEFFSSFELVDPNGIKQKLTVNDCIIQENGKIKDVVDPIQNTIEDCEHFKKFKEYFEKEKMIDFKNEQNNSIFI